MSRVFRRPGGGSGGSVFRDGRGECSRAPLCGYDASVRSLLVPLLFLAAVCSCKGGFGAEPIEPDAGIETPDAGPLSVCPNGAMSFEGKGFVKVDGVEAFDSPSDLTVEAWLFADPQLSNAQADIVSHHDDHNSDGWVLRYNKGLVFRLYAGAGDWTKMPANVAEAVDTSMTLGQWHHVAAVFEGATKSIPLFIDGKSAGANYRDKTMADRYSGPLTIGATAFEPGNGFRGIIDEVRVSRRVRYKDAAMFKPAYPLPDAEEGTIGTWHFPSGKTPDEQVLEATGKFTSKLATFATPNAEYPTSVAKPECPTGASP